MTKRASEDDARAFEEAMRGVRPLADDERAKRVPAPPARARSLRRAPARVDGGGAPDEPLTSAAFRLDPRGDSILGRANDVDARVLKRLATGEPPAEARLDLHGQRRDRALAALERFVAAARADGKRCVLVIHGRGAHSEDARAVLKPLVWRWLASAPAAAASVLAFASARPAQGGNGATLLLLRRESGR